MKRLIGLCAAALFCSAALFAQEGLNFKLSGDVDARAGYAPASTDSAFYGLAPAAETAAGAYVDGKIVFSRQYTTLGLLDYTFEESNLLDHTNGASLESLSFTVNELYADLNWNDFLFLRLGKQRLKWGAGYVFNPSDPVNPPKNPTSLRAVREGVPAAKVEAIGGELALSVFAVLFDAIDQTGVGAKISSSAIPGSDLAFSGYYSPSESWTAALNASITPFAALPGWDTIQLWFEGGIYDAARYAAVAAGPVPGAVVLGPPGGTSYNLLAGAQAELPVLRTILLTEYYHLSDGLDRGAIAAVYSALRSPDGAVVAASSAWYAELARRQARVATDYLFASISQPTITDGGNPVVDKIGLQATCLINLVDRSFFATGGITTAFVKDSEVDLTMTWAAGGAETEFGNLLSRVAASLDVKVFF